MGDMGKMEIKLNATVIQRIEITPDLIKLRVIPRGWDLPVFTPGQWAMLGMPGSAARCASADPEMKDHDTESIIRRAYSIASSSKANEYLEFYIGLVRSGALTPRLFNLRLGDEMWLSPKFSGMFTLSQVPNKFNAVLIATGTGVSPYMSMIRTEAAEGIRHRFAIIHGARHSCDLGYHSELTTLSDVSNVLAYLPIISRAEDEPVPWKGLEGFVQNVWTNGALDKAWGIHPTPEDTHVFLCGNPHMVDDMIEILGREGFRRHSSKNPGQIHVEQY